MTFYRIDKSCRFAGYKGTRAAVNFNIEGK